MNLDDPTFEELNRQIVVSEVQSAIKNLKRNKSVCPSDNLLNDYFIESSDILSTHITDIVKCLVLATSHEVGLKDILFLCLKTLTMLIITVE